MKCPTCTDTALVMIDRQGVEIDYCPQCRAVWPRPSKRQCSHNRNSQTPTTSMAEASRATARSPD
jgi:Zn-finger nucleic acid-binding protein